MTSERVVKNIKMLPCEYYFSKLLFAAIVPIYSSLTDLYAPFNMSDLRLLKQCQHYSRNYHLCPWKKNFNLIIVLISIWSIV